MDRHLSVLLLAALVCGAQPFAAGATTEQPAPAVPTAATRVVKGFELTIASTERSAAWTLQGQGRKGKSKHSLSLTPPPGQDVLIVRLRAHAIQAGTTAELGSSAVVGTDGTRHACALTRVILPVDGAALTVPCTVPVGSDLRAFEFEGQTWALPPPPARP